MSSSHRSVPPCEATVRRNEHDIGPMRLPAEDLADFVSDFNDTYKDAGLKIFVLSADRPSSNQVKPESTPSPQ